MKKVIETITRLALFLVIFVAMQIAAAYIVAPLPLDDMSLRRLVSYVVSMALTFAMLRVCERWVVPSREPIMANVRGFNPVMTLYGVVVLITLSIVLAPLERYIPADSRIFDDSVWTLINVVVVAPIFEEILFRGKLYNWLHVSCSPLIAILLSSMIFGIVHLEPIVLISGVTSGVLFGYAYLRTRSIIAPILLHMCNNALAYALTILSYNDRSLLELVDSEAYSLIIYITSAVIVLSSMLAMMIRVSKIK